MALARLLGLDAAALTEVPDPPGSPGDLAADIAGFKSLGACVTEHADLDPVLSDALRALGYETFVRDACRVLEAAHAKSSSPCRRIDATTLRQECEAVVAMTTGSPDDCPLRIRGTPKLGRDATCLAVASRDPRLCAGNGQPDKTRCEAISSQDEARCASLGVQHARACVRDAKRWRNVAPVTADTRVATKPRSHLTLDTVDRSHGPVDLDLPAMAATGVVALERGGELSFELGQMRDLGVVPSATSPEMGVRVGLSVVLAKGGVPAIRHFEIDVPGQPTLVVPPLSFDGQVTMSTSGARGEAVTLSLKGTLSAPPLSYRLNMNVETFVRDVIDMSNVDSQESHYHDGVP